MSCFRTAACCWHCFSRLRTVPWYAAELRRATSILRLSMGVVRPPRRCRPTDMAHCSSNCEICAAALSQTDQSTEVFWTGWPRSQSRIDAVRLFRYSALTFNGHRIHYDRDYCREEGYSGLLVHAPLQASLLAQFACSIKMGQAPRTFTHRAVRPLFDGSGTTLRAAAMDDGLDLWVIGPDGATTMSAKATW